MIEKDIERKVCDYAKSAGMLVYKFTSPSRAAVPDRMFITPTGKVWFIEFKMAGMRPTPMQQREHERLRGHRVDVAVVDNVDDGRSIVDIMLSMPC